jgi:cellulose synthase/poly-beta-1,6-N-acetylglucosamine synthase-like glycosyltransferase
MFLASVIVPVYNGASTLGACLRALAQQTVPGDSYEVIVVDDGSTDASAAIGARHGAQVVHQAHAGAAAARNRGARAARGEILLFTDADCEPQEDWIEAMLAPLVAPDVAGVKGVYRTRQRSVVARFAQAEYEEKYTRLAGRAEIDFVDTYAAAYRRAVFLQSGGFDTAFPRATVEDQELSYRLAAAGHKLVFAPGATVYHRHPGTPWQYARRKLHLGRWKVRVHARHPARALRDSYTPWTQKVQLVLLPLAIAAAGASVLASPASAGRRVSRRLAVSLMALDLASSLPLLAHARRQGWPVALAALPLALLRAAALDLGLSWGLLDRLVRREARRAREGQP